ncbi:restriction endonuclease [Halorussus salinisoli]|uniref:restriction endonuclease n=1 Tax=Halorussus salinisoli TaxID=2558242 RepID=UPI0010C1E99C|nr:restriction endonuclease [Halorussus salinisoli]
MLQGMDQSEFGQFVAALWERQGWQTQVKRDDGRVIVAVQRSQTGEEGLLWAMADDGEVGGQQVQQFASLCQQYDVAEAAIVTAGTFSDHADKVSQGSGVELLDGEGIARILQRKEWTDLAEQYGGGGGSDGDAAAEGDDGDSPLDTLKAVDGRASSLVSGVLGDADGSVPTKPVLAIVVVAALLAAGVLWTPSLPFVGGGSGPISAESAAPANSTTTLSVTWNAKVVDTIDPNESDGRAYHAPRGEQFVLVRMSLDNTGEEEVTVKQAGFELRTDERTYSHQPLNDHDGFVDFPISPDTNYVGWTVFAVPEGTTGTLVYDQNASDAPVSVEFDYDPNLAVNVTQR